MWEIYIMLVEACVWRKKKTSSATNIWKVKMKSTYNVNPLKSRDILDRIYLPIKKSVDILAILYSYDDEEHRLL